MAVPRSLGRASRQPFRYYRAPVSAQLDGLTEAYAALDGLPPAFVEVFEREATTGGEVIVSEAQGRVPYDKGELFRSIAMKVRDDGLQVAVGAYGNTEEEAEHATFVELGTHTQPADPWLYPSYLVGARYVRRTMKDWANEAGEMASSLRVRSRGRRRKRNG